MNQSDKPAGTDVLTTWEVAAINILIALDPGLDLDVHASRENMLALMQALDRGDLAPVLRDEAFIALTESLLLAVVRNERIEVADTSTYHARGAIIAAARVIYHRVVAEGLHPSHAEILAVFDGES